MEGNQPKIGKFSLNYGVLLGIISIVFSVMLFLQKMHYERSMAINIIGFVILFGVVLFGVSKFKNANEGYLNLSQALKLGTGIAVVGGLFGLVYYALLTNDIIEPGFMEKATEIAKEQAFNDNPNLTEEQWDQGVEMQKKFAWMAYPIIIIFNAILGLVSGLVSGLIMKKKRPEY